VSAAPCNVGAFVAGPPTSPRALVRHAELLAAYADAEIDDGREAYLSHFIYGPEMQAHYAANRNSVAGFAGPCWSRWLVLDIDRADLGEALADARRLVTYLCQRYPEADDVPIYFSGGKGFHVLVELAHNPPPAVGFQRVARTFAEGIAVRASVPIDTAIYDVAHLIRLPNTRHSRTGLFKRRIEADALFRLDLDGIRQQAQHPAGDGIPAVASCPANLAADWQAAERATTTAAHAAARRDFGTTDTRAPRYFLDFLRFGVAEGERHQTLFRCSAWLTEQGAPPSLISAVLVEPGRDVGLTPADVDRQIACGIDHVRRQRGLVVQEPAPEDRGDAWEHAADRLGVVAAATLEFPFGANADGPYGTAGERR
jgi:hypothetical protein